MSELDNLIRLGALCSGIAHGAVTGVARNVAMGMVKELSRELFPVAAKALVWSDDGYGRIVSQWFLGKQYQIATFRGGFILHFCDDESSEMVGAQFNTLEGAKAAAQSHHQARFMELCA